MHLLQRLDDPRDEARRRLLLAWLAQRGLALGGGGLVGARVAAQGIGSRPAPLGPDQAVFRTSGGNTVNGRPLTRDSRIAAGDTLRTGRDSELVFVVGTTAMLMRADSTVALQGGAEGGNPAAVRVASGKLVAVFASGQRTIATPTATVRISGTGVYVEADPALTYFCTCYGAADVSAVDDPASRRSVVTKHHDQPLYIAAGAAGRGRAIRNAPFINHNDDELSLLEALVGREPPFVHGKREYDRPRPPINYGR